MLYHKRNPRRFRGKKIGRRNRDHLRLPFYFPASLCSHRFSSTLTHTIDTTLQKQYVNTVSAWSFYRFDTRLDGTNDGFHYSNSGDGQPTSFHSFGAHDYRNWDLISGLYQRVKMNSMKLSLEMSSNFAVGNTTTTPTTWIAYVWTTYNNTTQSSANADQTDPLDMSATLNTAGDLPDSIRDSTNALDTDALMVHHRRVKRYVFHAGKYGTNGRIDVSIPFYTMRKLKIRWPDPYNRAAAVFTNNGANSVNAPVANGLTDTYGTKGQVNVLLRVGEFSPSDQRPSDQLGPQSFRVTKTFDCTFFDREGAT